VSKAAIRIEVNSRGGPQAALDRAAGTILSGGVVAFPTESFYGLAVNPFDDGGLKRLFEVKRRARDQPILVLIHSAEVLNQYVVGVPEIASVLMERFWPGGLTLVFEAKKGVSPLLTADTGKMGIRLSSHPVAKALARSVGLPITGTSANTSGEPPCMSADEVLRVLGRDVDLVLDGGRTRGGKGSTILDVTVRPPVLLREGMVTLEELVRIIGPLPG
jgi:L-threonylcarbamoyladenylate synthase